MSFEAARRMMHGAVLLVVAVVTFAALQVPVSAAEADHITSPLRTHGRDGRMLTAANTDFPQLRTWLFQQVGNTSAQDAEAALWFLVQFMPDIDKQTLPVSILLDSVTLALQARQLFPWAAAVPWSIFLNDVLPYATMTEPRDAWRPLFLDYFSKQPTLRAPNTTINTAVEWMNQFAWDIVNPPIVYNASGDPTGLNEYSPFEVMQAHYASCTGLSIFLVSSLRSIGIPARVAGTPHWNLGNASCPNGDASPDCGNHDWVEVWSNGRWSFVDERGNIALNTSWFFPGHAGHQVPNTLNHSIFATSFAPSSYVVATYDGDNDTLATAVPYFPMVWDWENAQVPAWDVTLRYLSMI